MTRIICNVKHDETILLSPLGHIHGTRPCQTAQKSQKLENMAADRHKFAASRSGKKWHPYYIERYWKRSCHILCGAKVTWIGYQWTGAKLVLSWSLCFYEVGSCNEFWCRNFTGGTLVSPLSANQHCCWSHVKGSPIWITDRTCNQCSRQKLWEIRKTAHREVCQTCHATAVSGDRHCAGKCMNMLKVGTIMHHPWTTPSKKGHRNRQV